jgi:outer membrane protein
MMRNRTVIDSASAPGLPLSVRRHAAGIAACAISALSAAAPAQAADAHGWERGDVVVRAGVAGILFHSSAQVRFGGNPVPGGSVALSNSVTPSGEIEYFPARSVSVAVNFGVPPEARITGTRTLAPLGEAGRVRYGLGAAVARFHLQPARRISPFAGVGVGRLFVLGTKDASVAGLSADSAWAPVIQGGVDWHIDRHISLYAHASYAPLKTNARGTALGLPMTARVTLNPVVVQGGLAFRF